MDGWQLTPRPGTRVVHLSDYTCETCKRIKRPVFGEWHCQCTRPQPQTYTEQLDEMCQRLGYSTTTTR